MARLNDTQALVDEGNRKHAQDRAYRPWTPPETTLGRAKPDSGFAVTASKKEERKMFAELTGEAVMPERRTGCGNESLRSATMYLRKGKL